MTTLQDTAVEHASRSELISPSPVLLLAPSEPRAPIAILSPAKRNDPGRLLQRGWAPQERWNLAWTTRWQAGIRHDDRRSRARRNADGDHKSSNWFSTIDGARELVCAHVAL